MEILENVQVYLQLDVADVEICGKLTLMCNVPEVLEGAGDTCRVESSGKLHATSPSMILEIFGSLTFFLFVRADS